MADERRKNRPWTREELLATFNLYLKLPFGKMHTGCPAVQKLAKLLQRSDSSIAIRLGNFAACDPYLKKRGIKGMSGGAKQCQPIWDEYFKDQESLVFESERLLAKLQPGKAEEAQIEIEGKDARYALKTRVNQSVFRQSILAIYDQKCAISGIDASELLVASHILPWAEFPNERLNPTNGICLSALYDKAFDKGLITISDQYKVVISESLRESAAKTWYDSFFAPYAEKEITLPEDYLPNAEFLRWHREHIFQG